MNVTILTSVHRWNDPRLFGRQAKTLALCGHSVRVAAPGAPTAIVDSVSVSGPPLPSSRWNRMSVTMLRLARSGLRRSDVVHIHDPELLLVVALLRPWLRRTAWVYDVHEDYAEQLQIKPWLPRLLRRPLSWVLAACERAVAGRCDLVIAATARIARRFNDDRTVIVQNYPDVSLLPPPRTPENQCEFRIVHLGEMNERRGASTLASAIEALPTTSAVVVEQIGATKPYDLFSGASDRLRVSLPTDHASALERLSTADAGLLLFQPGSNHDFSQPNKLFEYLAAGVPIVASDIAHWRQIVRKCGGLAVFVDPCDPQSVCEGLLEIEGRAEDSARITRAERARNVYSWDSQAKLLVSAYQMLSDCTKDGRLQCHGDERVRRRSRWLGSLRRFNRRTRSHKPSRGTEYESR